jgi:hypothetical protein
MRRWEGGKIREWDNEKNGHEVDGEKVSRLLKSCGRPVRRELLVVLK